jgi:L-rhamnose-H+ transport protein
MTESTGLGVALVLAGGIVHGSFALPMKRIRTWQWENIWLVYSVAGLIVLPLALALATVPRLFDVYGANTAGTLAVVALSGFGWGLGSTLFGLAIKRIGMALGFAIILGITSSLGSLLPLLVHHPEQLATAKGHTLLAGLAIAIAGIAMCSIAGGMRERDLNPGAGAGRRVLSGLLLCVASGILSPALNFGFEFGTPLRETAVAFGASETLATNTIWVLALGAGFLPNAGYSVLLLNRNRTWGLYGGGAPPLYWLGASVMGLLWFGGISIYGMGGAALGKLGAVVGWPIFMAMVILTANVWGVLTGEWRGASRRARSYSWAGVAILIAAIYVISTGA